MTQLRDDLITVEVPEGAVNFEVCNYGLNDTLEYDYPQGHEVSDLPPGSWQFICTTKDITEEQARGIVGSSEWYFPERHIRYIDYNHLVGPDGKQAWNIGFSNALLSLRSLLTSKGLDANKNYCLLKKEK